MGDASGGKALIFDASDEWIDPSNNQLSVLLHGISNDPVKPIVELTCEPVQGVDDVLVGRTLVRLNVASRPDLVDQSLPVFRQQRR